MEHNGSIGTRKEVRKESRDQIMCGLAGYEKFGFY